MTDFSSNQLAAAKTGSLGIGSMMLVAFTHLLSMPAWVQLTGGVVAIIASLYGMRLSRLNIKKTEAELKLIRAKAKAAGIDIDE